MHFEKVHFLKEIHKSDFATLFIKTRKEIHSILKIILWNQINFM